MDNAMAKDTKIELRGLYSRDLVEALDMIAIAQGRTRVELVGRVLAGYVATKQREASLVAKTAPINPPAVDSIWGGME